VNDITPGRFGAVEGTNTMEVHDVAGNVTTVTFVLDTTGPTITEKAGSSAAARSFSLDDLELGSGVAGVRINGVDFPLSANRWSDVNDLISGSFWGVRVGENTLVAYDALGNETTVTFFIEAPTVETEGVPEDETTSPDPSDGSEPGDADDATDGEPTRTPGGTSGSGAVDPGAVQSGAVAGTMATLETETGETGTAAAEASAGLPASLPATGGGGVAADQLAEASAAPAGGATSALPLIGAGMLVVLAGAGALVRLARR
ncbi:hypothetical protein, partial [Nocardioides sp. GY 10113]|uniref:hypothetical protein n=1 Tax=Nocardioides sp. GY 10113 TaxID=2569761 RepID=UPI00197DC9C7